MYDEITNTDFIVALNLGANMDWGAGALLDEAARRIRNMEAQIIAWEKVAEIVGCDGSDELERMLYQLPASW